MTMAYYPNRIRKFPIHRNLLDDVDAEHINAIQAELHSVMFSLGTAPHIYNNIETDGVSTVAVPNDEGGVTDDDTLFTPINRFYDPKVKPVNHGTVGQRLDNIERGQQFHVFLLRATNVSIGSSSTNLSVRPRAIRFPKPSTRNDPNGMFNGLGVTIRKSGFYLFSGNVTYTLLGTTSGANNGIYQATIDYDGAYLESMVRDQETGQDTFPILNPHLLGFFSRGTQISLRTSQNSGRTQRIRMARLSGVLLRETVDA